MDILQGSSSNALLYALDRLFGLLAQVFQSWLTHGTVTRSFLACAFIPLVKGSKNPAVTDLYWAIARSTLRLKVFEHCVILTWGDKLNSDSLQFGFKKRTGTGQATWLVQEVMQHYLRQGGRPVAVVLDCSKAFDLAKFSIMFDRLLAKGMPAVVLRVLALRYQEQVAWVRWGRSKCSEIFKNWKWNEAGISGEPGVLECLLRPPVPRTP
jgi:hypothetical protein